MIEVNQKTVRLSVYILGVSLLSLVLQALVQELAQLLILPVFVPFALLGLVFHHLFEFVRYLDVNSGPFAAYMFRGFATGLFWGGCIVYPIDMLRRTKDRKYKTILVSLGLYLLLIFLALGYFIFGLANSGWTD